MEKTGFKVGDIVKYKGDDNNRYKVLEVDDNGVVKVESLINGAPYSFLPDSLELGDGIKPGKRAILDANGNELKLGDLVRRRGGNMDERWKVTELNFDTVMVKLSDPDGSDRGYYGPGVLVKIPAKEERESRPRYDNGDVIEMGDFVKYLGGNIIYKVMDILSHRQVSARRVDTREPSTLFTENLMKASYEEVKKALPKESPTIHCGKDGSGKDDRADHKPRWELLPLDAIEEIVKVYTMGAEKYADNAWKTIPDAHRRYLAALFRHVAAYERGERLDKESGLSHLAHAAWNAIAILWLDMHKLELNGDDV